jgi:hypothetical protein
MYARYANLKVLDFVDLSAVRAERYESAWLWDCYE